MPSDRIGGDALPTQYSIGLSSIIGITGLPGQISVSLEYVSGGTLEIVHPNASVTWGQGWIIPTQSIISIDTSGTFWVASSGATTLINVLRIRAHGFEGATFGYRG